MTGSRDVPRLAILRLLMARTSLAVNGYPDSVQRRTRSAAPPFVTRCRSTVRSVVMRPFHQRESFWRCLNCADMIIRFMNEVTRILSSIEQGNPQAAEQLLPLVYDELRKLAAHKMAQEAPGQTLQATALVHEAYLRVVDTA
jgi:hypothetical protein